MEYVAIGVSVVALMISGLAWRETKRQADAAVRDADLAERRYEGELAAGRSADLVVLVERLIHSYALVIRNVGLAVARGVDLAAEPVLGDERGMPQFVDPPLPCDIPPGGEVSIAMWVGGGMVDRLQVAVTWSDSGGPKEYKAVVAIV